MGVHGFTRLLYEEGLLPGNGSSSSNECECSASLWRLPKLAEEAEDEEEERIPPGSILYVDGNGLSFFLYQVASARHAQAVLQQQGKKKNKKKKSSNSTSGCCCIRIQGQGGGGGGGGSSALEPWQVQRLLPTFLPLQYLEEATRDFCRALQDEAGCELRVYWDGEYRRALKESTDQQRRDDLDADWSTLQVYCQQGRFPPAQRTCQWQDLFPAGRLRNVAVQHALAACRVPQILCIEEADPVLAREASGNPRAFVLGQDSDFCFFKGIQYVPFNTLRVVQDDDDTDDNKRTMVVTARVLRRSMLAKRFDLPDEDALIELAIALGNDYVQAETAPLDLPNNNNNNNNHRAAHARDRWDWIRDQGPGFRVTAKRTNNNNAAQTNNDDEDEAGDRMVERTNKENGGIHDVLAQETEQALRFVRRLYNLESLDEYPLIEHAGKEDNDEDEIQNQKEQARVQPLVPRRIKQMLETLQGGTTTTTRSIEELILEGMSLLEHALEQDDHDDNNNNRENKTRNMRFHLRHEHIHVWRNLISNSPEWATTAVTRGGDEGQNLRPSRHWRPSWEDIGAVYVLENLIKAAYGLSRRSKNQQQQQQLDRDRMYTLLTRYKAPHAIFDSYTFLLYLEQHRRKQQQEEQDLQAHLSSLAITDAQQKSTLQDNDHEVNAPPAQEQQNQPHTPRPSLPIDDFQEEIIDHIENHRVSILQAETGAGKSSRIPIMVLEAPPPDPLLPKVKMFISQPRRIAAKALVERIRNVEPKWKDRVALRMGHGVREYENSQTQAWFVTTGYLVRLLANHPEKFNDVSHLIIDEVHERSVDTDVLCLLCRRLLQTNLTIRLVLMSATLAATLYQEYFGVPEPPIKVGGRRFPVRPVYLEDLTREFKFPTREIHSIEKVITECAEMRCKRPPSAGYLEKLYNVVAYLATLVGTPGSSVLIFVPGMNDIVSITELIEQMFVPGVTFKCLPVHSDIPFEDQMLIFDEGEDDVVKIVIATNAAESSVTLPDVDSVICLGLCKQITYNESSHRQMLMPAWISRASATQRAGRTGRLRPGTVYRMYTQETFENHMDSFEPGEMLRIPLDSVILMLKEMLSEDRVTDVLLNCLEPPNIATIDRSFKSLHQSHFISSAEDDDECHITNLGKFVSAIGIDLALGSLIGLGIQFGVGPECIQMAAVLSFPKTPWIMSNPLIHEMDDYNAQVVKTYKSKCHFDANLFSEPMAAMNLLWDYSRQKNKQAWCYRHGIFHPRVRRLASTSDNLRRRVADFVGIEPALLDIKDPPMTMPHAKVTLLRVIQVWVFHETIIECRPESFIQGASEDSFTLQLRGRSSKLDKEHLRELLDMHRHPFEIKAYSEYIQKGSFSRTEGNADDFEAHFDECEHRFLSYATEKQISLVWILSNDDVAVYVEGDLAESGEIAPVLDSFDKYLNSTRMLARPTKRGRGRAERPCGLWTLVEEDGSMDGQGNQKLWLGFCGTMKSKNKKALSAELAAFARVTCTRAISCKIQLSKNKISFELVSRCHDAEVSLTDIKDMFATAEVKITFSTNSCGNQQLVFPVVPASPSPAFGRLGSGANMEETSCDRSPLDCIPEGARLLSVLASGRRREHVVMFTPPRARSGGADHDDNEEEEDAELVEIHLEPSQTKIMERWKRHNTSSQVFVESNSVPASALPMSSRDTLYCCCANTLDLRGGGLRADGLTLLPPGPLFLMLSKLTFGLVHWNTMNEDDEQELIVEKMLASLDPSAEIFDESARHQIEEALSFHESAKRLEETLECFPDMTRRLIQLFDGVDGYESREWEGLDEDPFIAKNIERHVFMRRQKGNQKRTTEQQNSTSRADKKRFGGIESSSGNEAELTSDGSGSDTMEAQQVLRATSHLQPTGNLANDRSHGTEDSQSIAKRIVRSDTMVPVQALSNKKKHGKGSKPKSSSNPGQGQIPEHAAGGDNVSSDSKHLNGNGIKEDQTRHQCEHIDPDGKPIFTEVEAFDGDMVCLSEKLFRVNVPAGENLTVNELHSTNILAHIVASVLGVISEQIGVFGPHWKLFSVPVAGSTYFTAKFDGAGLPLRKRKGDYSKWLKLKGKNARPGNLADAKICVPFHFRETLDRSLTLPYQGRKLLVFQTAEMALRMEAAFWLERQFRTKNKHWYERKTVEMIQTLLDQCSTSGAQDREKTPSNPRPVAAMDAETQMEVNDELLVLSEKLFATHIDEAERRENDLLSTNILCVVLTEVLGCSAAHIGIGGEHWKVFNGTAAGLRYYRAEFSGLGLPPIRRKPTQNGSWMTKNDPPTLRPWTVQDALDCIPTSFIEDLGVAHLVAIDGTPVVVFRTVELAIQMECAFWLERMCRTVGAHWYELTTKQLGDRLRVGCGLKKKQTKKKTRPLI